MTFWTQLDEHAIELRSEAIRRLGLGMDMPPEVLQGSADSNHWAAWQADEAAIKRGAQRVHARRFLPEDILMGLPGALLLGPGWAAATYWQRYVEAVVRVCGSAK